MTDLLISGFKHQVESAFKLKRLPATIILLVALIMTFVAAFVLPSILCIIFVIVSRGNLHLVGDRGNWDKQLTWVLDSISRLLMGK